MRWSDSIELTLPHDCILSKAHLQKGHGSAWETWHSLGCPPNLTPSQEEALRTSAEPDRSLTQVPAGPQTLDFRLNPYEVLYLEWAPADASAERRGILL